MKQKERTTAFIAAMLLAFGISLLNFEDPAFDNNQKPYIAIIAGIVLAVIFTVNYYRNRPHVWKRSIHTNLISWLLEGGYPAFNC